MKNILSLALIMAIYPSFAQIDTLALRKKYDAEVISIRSFGYDKGGKSHPTKNLKDEFNLSPEGLKYFNMSKSDRKKTWICYSLAFASLAGGALALQHKEKELGLALWAGTYVSLGFTFHFMIRSESRLTKALWLRNRDALLR